MRLVFNEKLHVLKLFIVFLNNTLTHFVYSSTNVASFALKLIFSLREERVPDEIR